MEYDVSAAMAQKTELDKAADEITMIISRLENARNEYIAGWKSAEVYDVESAIDADIRKLRSLRDEIQDAGHAILKNAEDIQREEEERLAREEEERRAKEEEERLAREEEERLAAENAAKEIISRIMNLRK